MLGFISGFLGSVVAFLFNLPLSLFVRTKHYGFLPVNEKTPHYIKIEDFHNAPNINTAREPSHGNTLILKNNPNRCVDVELHRVMMCGGHATSLL